jgi:hypothetical protein
MRHAIATVTLESASPYSQSRAYDEPKLDQEGADAYDLRTWRERCHTNADGHIVIPGTQIKQALSGAAKYLSMQIPGKGKATYTKHMEAGVLVMGDIVLAVTKADVPVEKLYVPSDGRRGGTTRVFKRFPRIDAWKGTLDILVIDPIITEPVLVKHLDAAGLFIGLGRFRPRQNGFYGRFSTKGIKWREQAA